MLKRHQDALDVIVARMNDQDTAEQYCKSHYSETSVECRQVFDHLSRLYFMQADRTMADNMQFVNKYGDCLDARAVIIL